MSSDKIHRELGLLRKFCNDMDEKNKLLEKELQYTKVQVEKYIVLLRLMRNVKNKVKGENNIEINIE